jgi:hypothetical protein
MAKIIDVLEPAAVGALFTSFGYGLKLFSDYYFLKSPHLQPFITIIGTSTMPPVNGFRNYSYKITLELYNHSKNEAYGFNIDKFIVDDVFKLKDFQKDISKNPITDAAPIRLEVSYDVLLPVTPGKETMDSNGRINDLSKAYSLEMSFKNALGKEYKKTFKGLMDIKTNPRIFQIGWSK